MSDDTKNCPFCAEEILTVAKKCKHCGSMLDDASSVEKTEEALNPNLPKWVLPAVILSPIVGLFLWAQIGNMVDSTDDASSQTAHSSDTQMQQSRPTSYDSGLQQHAMRLVNDRNVGVAGLCDKIYDVKFNQVSHGTLKANNAGNTRFPGMVANVEYMCVNPITGDRQKKTDYWLIFGHDEITGQLRCAGVAGRPFIEGLMSDCDFKEGAG